jgi:phenylacetate-CoA ligase
MRKSAWQTLIEVSGVGAKLRRLRADQYRPRAELEQTRQFALSALLRHARRHVPYYRERLAPDLFDAAGHVRLAAFSALPPLDRTELRRHFRALKADDLSWRIVRTSSSGGSTGQPAVVLQDLEFINWLRAIKLLDDEWAGQKAGDRKLLLWGSRQEVIQGSESRRVRWARWLKNEEWLNAYRLTPARMLAYTKQIEAWQPQLILAYPESMYEFSRFVQANGHPAYQPRAIMTSGGTLHAHMRTEIEATFGARVFNRYGSREVGDAACECYQHDGLHVCESTHLIEIVDGHGAPVPMGEWGEILVTTLHNRAMPLIRYRIGDTGRLTREPCPCGRTWIRLAEVSGRVTDVFHTRAGGVVVPECLMGLAAEMLNGGWVRCYQMVQTELEAITIRIVRVPGDYLEHEKELAALAAGLRSVMGASCRISVEWVVDIAPTPSGKFRSTICALPNGADGRA